MKKSSNHIYFIEGVCNRVDAKTRKNSLCHSALAVKKEECTLQLNRFTKQMQNEILNQL